MGAKTTQPLLQVRAVVSQHVCGADLGPPEDGEGARWQQKALCPVALRSPSGGEDVRAWSAPRARVWPLAKHVTVATRDKR